MARINRESYEKGYIEKLNYKCDNIFFWMILFFLVITSWFFGSKVFAAEVIKAEPMVNSMPIIRPQIVVPPSQPIQTTPSVNYVPKVHQTTTTVVPNATPKISAQPTVQTSSQTTVQTTGEQVSPVVPQMVSFQQCTKIFPTDSEKLFYIALASVNANKFKIDEIQTKSGYILFSVVKKQFLLNIATVDKKNAIIKITPTNNNYYFPVGIVTNLFKYIDLNIDMPITKI